MDKLTINCTCGYSWDTKSLLMYITCPSCGRKCYNKDSKFTKKEVSK